MRYASLKYNNTNNLGDEIQTLAAEQFLPHVDERFDRDKLAMASAEEPHIMILNGWYGYTPELSFPPAEFIKPVLISMHINRRVTKHFLSEKCIAYFKKHEPVGCRDEETMRLLQGNGVDAYFSKCLTLTFPKRTVAPSSPKVLLVDLPSHVANLIPNDLGPRESIKQSTNEYGDLKFDMARTLLKKYREEATLVITSRLHCALPCVAMGIPVVLWANPNSTRLQVAHAIGLKIHNDLPVSNLNVKITGKLKNFAPANYILKKLDAMSFFVQYKLRSTVNWQPEVLDIEEHKEVLIQKTNDRLRKIGLTK